MFVFFFCRYQFVKCSDETIDDWNPSSWNVRGLESEWKACSSRSSNTVDVHSSSAHAEQLHGFSSTYEWPINTSWTHQRSNATTDEWSWFSSSTARISPRSWFSTDSIQLRLGSFVFIRGDPTGRFQTTENHQRSWSIGTTHPLDIHSRNSSQDWHCADISRCFSEITYTDFFFFSSSFCVHILFLSRTQFIHVLSIWTMSLLFFSFVVVRFVLSTSTRRRRRRKERSPYSYWLVRFSVWYSWEGCAAGRGCGTMEI